MSLTANSLGHLSSKYSLSRHGKAIGEYQGKMLKGGIEITLEDGRDLFFSNRRFSKKFQLKDKGDGSLLGTCKSLGFFADAWEVSLSDGPAKLEAKGVSNTKCQLTRDDKVLAHMGRVSDTSNNWVLNSVALKTLEDELLVGMMFYTILRRYVSNSV